MNAIVSKMRSGELSMGGCHESVLSNSQKAERFFQGTTGFSGLISGNETHQFGGTQVLGQTAIVHGLEEADEGEESENNWREQ